MRRFGSRGLFLSMLFSHGSLLVTDYLRKIDDIVRFISSELVCVVRSSTGVAPTSLLRLQFQYSGLVFFSIHAVIFLLFHHLRQVSDGLKRRREMLMFR